MFDIMDVELDEHRETRIQDGLKALWNAMVRLFVQEVSTSELPSEVAHIFSRNEISLSNVRVWKVVITGDMEELYDTGEKGSQQNPTVTWLS